MIVAAEAEGHRDTRSTISNGYQIQSRAAAWPTFTGNPNVTVLPPDETSLSDYQRSQFDRDPNRSTDRSKD
jgi:hypothetical protein